MAEVGSAYMSIMPSAKGFGRSLESEVSGEVGTAGKGIGSKFGSALKLGAVAAVGGAVIAGAFLKSSLGEAREAQKVAAQTNAVIKSTGGIAGVTAEQVGKLASAISMKTGIDDESIQSGQNLLLTFKNIRNEAGVGNDIFNQTTKTLVDMAAAMGTEPKAAAIQLGKALNDPVKGISALSRVGVTFTEGQKKVIEGLVKGGDVMGAQKIILKELNSEFGGSAAAQATAGDKLKVAWGNLQETVGTALLPLWDRMLTGMTQVTLYLTSQVGPAFAKVSAFISPLVAQVQSAFGGAGGTGGGMMTSLRAVGDYVMTTLGPIFTQYVGILQNRVLPIVRDFAAFYVGTLAPAMAQVYATVAQKLKPIFDQLAETYRAKLLPAAEKLLVKFHEWQPTIQKVAAVVAMLYGKWLVFEATILSKVLPVVIRFIGFLVSNAVPAIIRNIEIAAKFVGAMIKLGQAVVDRVQDFARFLSAVKDKFTEAVNFVRSIPGKIKSALGDLGNILYAAGRALIGGLIAGITDRVKDVGSAVSGLAGKIKGYFPGSPVKEGPLTSWNNGGAGKRLIQMLTDGIIAGTPGAVAAAVGTATAIEKGVLEHLTSMRDKARGILDGLKSDFSSLRDTVAGAFTTDLFSGANSHDFLLNLVNTKGTLQHLKKAFKKLIGWGVSPQFLSQLFSSGNGGLILDLASGDRISALTGASLFQDVGNLSNSLGGQVAQADIGPKIDRTNQRLERIEKALDRLPARFGKELNGAVGHGQRKAS